MGHIIIQILMTDPKNPKKALAAIFLIVVVDILGLAIVLPLLPFYAEHYGATPQVVGFLVTLYALCQLFAGPILGRISDRTGRKPMLIVSQIGTCIGFIVLAKAHALWMIFLSRFIDGVTAGNLPIAQAFISDVTESKDRSKAFAIIGIAFGVGFFIGPALSGYLSQFGYSYPAWAAAALSFTSILCSTFLLPTGPVHQNYEVPEAFHPRQFIRYFKKPVLGNLLLQFFCFGLAFSGFMSGFALFAERRFMYHGHAVGATEVGYFYTYFGLLGILFQGYLLGKLVKRYGEKKLIVVGFLAQGLGYAGFAFVFHLPALFATAVVAALGSGVVRPTLTSLVTQNASRTEQGAVLGVSQSLVSIAQILAPMLSGFLIERHWLHAWALIVGSFALGGFLINRLRPEAVSAH